MTRQIEISHHFSITLTKFISAAEVLIQRVNYMKCCLNACGKVCLIIERVENQRKTSNYEDICPVKSVKNLRT